MALRVAAAKKKLGPRSHRRLPLGSLEVRRDQRDDRGGRRCQRNRAQPEDGREAGDPEHRRACAEAGECAPLIRAERARMMRYVMMEKWIAV